MMIVLNVIYGQTRFEVLATCSAKSTNLLEYPHSLSYHETSLTNLSLNYTPALLSKTLVWDSWTKSLLTT